MVAKQVKIAWETIFTRKKFQSTDDHSVFYTRKFKNIKNKIKNKDKCLTKEATTKETTEIVEQISNNTSPGPDNIPNEIIKIMHKTEIFAIILNKIINTCIIQQKTPKQWKSANIYTIYKKDNPNNPLNYRPIALLNTTYKIYSSLITKRLSNFLENNECLSQMQGGFRRDRPTFAKMWTLRNIIEHSIINDQELHVCYLDIQKAYDSVEY